VATAKAERLLNLVIALVNAPRFRTATWIRERVAGYGDAPTEEAFFRTFERDKTELRDMGIPLVTSDVEGGDEGQLGYRIPPGEFALPPVSFTPTETAALGLASRLWETTALAAAGSGALRKIRDATPDRPENAGDRTAAGLLQPRVRTADPSFSPLYAAVQARRAVTFDYRKHPRADAEQRTVAPWGLVSYRGRWYLVGFDTDRQDRRTFRLSRIAGTVRTVGRAGAVTVPPGLDLLQMDRGSDDVPVERFATLLLRTGRGDGLRRLARQVDAAELGWLADAGTDDGWDRVRIPLGHLWDSARSIAANGPDVIVEDPPDLRDAVIRVLSGSSEVGPGVAPSASGAASGTASGTASRTADEEASA
jgi:proteasome accessory factor B